MKIIITGFACNKKAYEHLADEHTLILHPHEANIELTEKTCLLGHSLGGQVALKLAMAQADKIQKVITYASTPCFMAHEPWQGLSQKQIDVLKANIQSNPKAAIMGFHKWQLSGANNVRAKLKRLIPTEFHVEHLIQELTMLEQHDLRGLKFDFEAQHVNSEDDVIVNAKQVANTWGKVTLIRAGSHSFCLEDQKEVVV